MAPFDLERALSRPWLKWLLIVAAWTLFGSLIAGETYIQTRSQGRPLTLGQAFTWYLAWAYAWALFTPIALWLRRRVPFTRKVWPRALIVHLTASLVLAWMGALVYVGVGQALGRLPAGAETLVGRSLALFVVFLHFDPALYWIIVGLSYAAYYYRESRERELRASQLEAQLAQARLQALEMQLHPHFLFNALNTIAVLVRTSRNAQAVRVVTGLAELLRRALDSAGVHLVSLKQEIEFVRRYLEIEQIRFGDRLRVEVDVDPRALDARVPHLLLQPLVENAIQHGVSIRSSGGSLEIRARRLNGRVYLSVRDDGPGLQGVESNTGNGLGLRTTRERLRQLYGDDHAFTVRDADGNGVLAELDIPFDPVPEERWESP